MLFGNGRLAVPAILLATAACDQTVTSPQVIEPATSVQALHASPGGRVSFNPQPEPPAMLVAFQLFGQIDGRLRGDYRLGGGGGALTVETLSSERRGAVLHVSQRWTVHPPEPVHPPDPIHPPEPVQPVVLELHGILQRGGRFVLNGADGAGGAAHVRGVAAGGGGGLSIGGELMFNPQPEPPAQR